MSNEIRINIFAFIVALVIFLTTGCSPKQSVIQAQEQPRLTDQYSGKYKFENTYVLSLTSTVARFATGTAKYIIKPNGKGCFVYYGVGFAQSDLIDNICKEIDLNDDNLISIKEIYLYFGWDVEDTQKIRKFSI